MTSQPPTFLFCYNRSIPSLTYVGLLLIAIPSIISYLQDPAVYPYFDIYGTGSPKEDQWVPLSTLLPTQYPALSLCELWHHFTECRDI
jgi:hypothetical protein